MKLCVNDVTVQYNYLFGDFQLYQEGKECQKGKECQNISVLIFSACVIQLKFWPLGKFTVKLEQDT